MTKIVIFGATGSIGTSALKIIKNNKDFELVGIGYFTNKQRAKKIAREFNISNILQGNNANKIDNFLKTVEPDLVLNAVSGSAGVIFSYITIKNKKTLILANKETLVCCGKQIMSLAKQKHVKIYPIDSEHSAVYTLLKHKTNNKKIKEIIITASGGPFYNYKYKELLKIKYSQAIHNPNWVMGEKVSVDSSTMLNKSFEIIEAYWLFPHKKIIALLQPSSKVHALIKYIDNSVDAYISKSDMHIPIKNAIYQYKINDKKHIFHFENIKNIKYELKEINNKYLKGYSYAKLMLNNINTSLPAIINIADEKAIKLFKCNKISFLDIYKYIDGFIKKHKNVKFKSILEFLNFYNKFAS